jgi:hypothetical protein
MTPERSNWRIAGLGIAATFLTAGLGLLAASLVPRTAWFLVIASLGIAVAAFAVRPPQSRGPRLSRHFRLVSYKQAPYPDRRYPHAAEIRFRSKRLFQPARIRLTCDAPVYSAATVIEHVEDGEFLEGYAFEKNLQGHTVLFEFSEPAFAPQFVCIVEVRSHSPISVLSVDRLPGPVAPGTTGMDTAAMARDIRDRLEAMKAAPP